MSQYPMLHVFWWWKQSGATPGETRSCLRGGSLLLNSEGKARGPKELNRQQGAGVGRDDEKKRGDDGTQPTNPCKKHAHTTQLYTFVFSALAQMHVRTAYVTAAAKHV